MINDYYPEYEEERDLAAEHAHNSFYEDDRYFDIMAKIDIAKFLLKGLTKISDNITIEDIQEVIGTLEEAENV